MIWAAGGAPAPSAPSSRPHDRSSASRPDRQGRPRRPRPRRQGGGALPARRRHGGRVHGTASHAGGSSGDGGTGGRGRARGEPTLGRTHDAGAPSDRADAARRRRRHPSRRRRRRARRGRAGAPCSRCQRRDPAGHAARGDRGARPRPCPAVSRLTGPTRDMPGLDLARLRSTRGVDLNVWPPRYDTAYAPTSHEACWLPEVECAPPAARDALILAKLRAQLQYAWDRCPFYRRKWEAAGVSPGTLRSLDDLAAFPAVEKAELRAAQAAVPPFGDYLGIEPHEVARIDRKSVVEGKS